MSETSSTILCIKEPVIEYEHVLNDDMNRYNISHLEITCDTNLDVVITAIQDWIDELPKNLQQDYYFYVNKSVSGVKVYRDLTTNDFTGVEIKGFYGQGSINIEWNGWNYVDGKTPNNEYIIFSKCSFDSTNCCGKKINIFDIDNCSAKIRISGLQVGQATAKCQTITNTKKDTKVISRFVASMRTNFTTFINMKSLKKKVGTESPSITLIEEGKTSYNTLETKYNSIKEDSYIFIRRSSNVEIVNCRIISAYVYAGANYEFQIGISAVEGSNVRILRGIFTYAFVVVFSQASKVTNFLVKGRGNYSLGIAYDQSTIWYIGSSPDNATNSQIYDTTSYISNGTATDSEDALTFSSDSNSNDES